MRCRDQESGVRSSQRAVNPLGVRLLRTACSYGASRQTDRPQYCCYGCRFAASIAAGRRRRRPGPLGDDAAGAGGLLLDERDGLHDAALVAADGSRIRPARRAIWYDLARYACLLFTLPVVLLLGGPLLEDAGGELRRGRPSLSLLLCVGVAAALAYSIWSLLAGGGHVYFEVACDDSRRRDARPLVRSDRQAENDRGAARPAAAVARSGAAAARRSARRSSLPAICAAGDRFRVLPGERIAADGQIVQPPGVASMSRPSRAKACRWSRSQATAC